MTTAFTQSGPLVVYGVSREMYDDLLRALDGCEFPHRYEHEALQFPPRIDRVSPATYKALLDALGDYRLRHTYLDGALEMMSPRKDHDRIKKLLGRLIEMMAIECDIEIQSIGSTTITSDSHDKGVEPDEAYYVANEAAVRYEELFDPARDPPPDLILEVAVTRNSLKRMRSFAAIGIPEVWQHDGDHLHFFELCDGEYRPINRSLSFPVVKPADIERILELRTEMGENALVLEFVKWLREQP
jgi:Uma2 family endonuclease